MKVTLFTGNQPRHLALAARLADIADEVFLIQETKTSFAGKRDAIHAASPTMEEYFARVMAAECAVFGDLRFSVPGVRVLSLFMGDLSYIPLKVLQEAMCADFYIVFGASYIRGPLADFLVERRCVNVHMGLSPYYRGSACNFWAMYDERPDLVGATLHLLSKGLDSGPILLHALPKPEACDGFFLGMRAVKAAQVALCERIANGSLYDVVPLPQDRSAQIRYTRSRDFNDAVVAHYLGRLMSVEDVELHLTERRGDSKLFNEVFV